MLKGTAGAPDATVLRPVGAQPVCRCVPRPVRGGARASRCSSAQHETHRRARGQLLEPRHGRPRLRPAQPRSAGHVRAPRSDDRHAVRRARRAGRQGPLGRRAQRRSRRDADSRAARRRRQGCRADQRRRAHRRRQPGAAARRSGQGRHVTALSTNDLYFEPGVYDKVRRTPAAISAAIAAITARPGVQRVFRSEDVRDAANAKDPLLRAAALSYFPGRSGDLIIATKPGWMISAAGTTHGSAQPRRPARAAAVPRTGRQAGQISASRRRRPISRRRWRRSSGSRCKAEGHPLF